MRSNLPIDGDITALKQVLMHSQCIDGSHNVSINNQIETVPSREDCPKLLGAGKLAKLCCIMEEL